jgi:hypothetical protein
MLEGVGMFEPAGKTLTEDQVLLREGLGRSAPLRNPEASRRTPGRARLRRGARLHGHQPSDALPPHERARNRGAGGGRPGGQIRQLCLAARRA